VHTAYLLNLAAPDPDIHARSADALLKSAARAAEIGAQFVVTHLGSHKGEGYEGGISRICEAVQSSLPTSRDPRGPIILLENSAGAGNTIGSRFEHLADILACLGTAADRVGICLDTCHLFAAGYNVSTAEGLEATLAEMDRLVGISRLRLLHLNDTRSALGSHLDRHWHIGQGRIGLDAFRRILRHSALSHLPGILETPMEDGWDAINLAALRALRG
jgi:deoxyribonuclease-4